MAFSQELIHSHCHWNYIMLMDLCEYVWARMTQFCLLSPQLLLETGEEC